MATPAIDRTVEMDLDCFRRLFPPLTRFRWKREMPSTRSFVRIAATVAVLACSAQFVPADEPLQVLPLLGEKPGVAAGGSAGEKPEISVTLTPRDAGPGDEVVLAVKLSVPEGSYTYSANPELLGATRISVDATTGLESLESSFTGDRTPKSSFDVNLKRQVEKYFGDVTWSRRYRVSNGINPDDVSVSGQFVGQVCNDRSCRPIRETIQVSLNDAPPQSLNRDSESAEHPFEKVVVPARKPDRPEPITFTFNLGPQDAKPGDEVTLSITADPAGEYHIFALNQNPKMAGMPTTFRVAAHPGLEPIDAQFQPSKSAEIEKPLPNIIQHVHYGRITWTKRFRVTESATSSGYGVEGNLKYQICRESSCRIPVTVSYALGNVSSTAPVQEQLPGGSTNGDAEAADTNRASDMGLVTFLVTAFLAGFTALITPCVFPMIPITVSFFLKQSEKEHHRPVTMALVYCLGIVGTFTGLGLLMAVFFRATALNQMANNPWVNLFIAGVLVFFGMNLLGMFEIRMPSWILNWSSGQQSKGGFIGVLFMALTFTLVSFTCTFAFAGGLLVLAANGEYFWPILGMLAFSAAFSLPFFFLALFPSFLQKLPKSGGWMNTVKVTMGLIECGAAFKFFSVADLAWNPVPMIFDYSMVMTAWIVLSICAALYLLGLYRLPHDSPTEKISAVRLAFAMTFFGLAGYLSVGLFAAEKPSGKVWEQIAAFATPKFEGGEGDIGPYVKYDGLRYALDYAQARSYARARNQPLLLDFTGVNCVNCRKMEGLMTKEHNRQELEKFVRVQLYTDNVPLIRDRERVEELLESNRELQENWFGDVTLPAYAVVTPDGKTVLATFLGLEQREGQFAQFLADGHAKWRRLASNDKRVKTAKAGSSAL